MRTDQKDIWAQLTREFENLKRQERSQNIDLETGQNNHNQPTPEDADLEKGYQAIRQTILGGSPSTQIQPEEPPNESPLPSNHQDEVVNEVCSEFPLTTMAACNINPKLISANITREMPLRVNALAHQAEKNNFGFKGPSTNKSRLETDHTRPSIEICSEDEKSGYPMYPFYAQKKEQFGNRNNCDIRTYFPQLISKEFDLCEETEEAPFQTICQKPAQFSPPKIKKDQSSVQIAKKDVTDSKPLYVWPEESPTTRYRNKLKRSQEVKTITIDPISVLRPSRKLPQLGPRHQADLTKLLKTFKLSENSKKLTQTIKYISSFKYKHSFNCQPEVFVRDIRIEGSYNHAEAVKERQSKVYKIISCDEERIGGRFRKKRKRKRRVVKRKKKFTVKMQNMYII